MTDYFAVFGVELEFLLKREAGGDHVAPGTVPIVIEQCLSEIERRGLNEVGICAFVSCSLPRSMLTALPKIALPVPRPRSMLSRMHTIGANTPLEKGLMSMLCAIW